MSSTSHGSSSEGLIGGAREGVGDAAATMQEKAGELKQQGRGRLGETLDQRTNQVGSQAQHAARAMRQTGSQIRAEGEPGNQQVAGVLEAAAGRIERLGGYLEHTSGDRILDDVEDFARRQPWALAGIGLMVGLAASRFLKASSERRYVTRRPAYRSAYSTAGGSGYSGYEPSPASRSLAGMT